MPVVVTAQGQKALAVLSKEPGSSVARVARELGIDHSTAAYHLRRLERMGIVQSRVIGRTRCHFVASRWQCETSRQAAVFMSAPGGRAVLERLASGGAWRANELSKATEIRVGRVRWIIRRGETCGLLERVRYGRYALALEARLCASHALSGSPCQRLRR